MEQSNLQLADLPGSATGSEPTSGAAATNQSGGDDDDSDKGGDEDVPMTFPQRVSEVKWKSRLCYDVTLGHSLNLFVCFTR